MSVTTGKVRASFVHVFQPQAPLGGGEAKYSITLLIPKSDQATLNQLYAAIEAAKQDGVSKAFKGVMPAQLATPIYDGDGPRPNGDPFGEECHGCMVLRASSKDQPSVVDLNIQPIINPSDMYSGCYVRANINFYAYNSNGNRGIGCGLNSVQKVAEGEPLTARVSAQEAFGGNNVYPSGAAQAYNQAPATNYSPTPAPQMGYPPVQAPQGAYGQPVPNAYPPVQAPQRAYGQPGPGGYPQQPAAIDPITGAPMVGGVMGI